MLITPPNLDSSELKAFFTTRILTDGKEHHISDALANELGVPKGDIFMPAQKHTGSVHVLGTDPAPVVADAVVTSRKKIFIGVLVADCVPVLLYDPEKEVAGAVHAGWRGTAQRILVNTIMTMHEKFLCSASDILVAIGPSIKQCSYQVGEEVVAGVRKATGEGDYYYEREGKYYIDLANANRIQAMSMGIPEGNIWQSGECTFCNPERFYSYRYSKSTGRQGGFIGMW